MIKEEKMDKKKIDLNKLSFEELKTQIENLEKEKDKVRQKEGSPWIIGENYFIRTVTMALCGRLVDVTDKEIILESASWVADTGRFTDFIVNGKLDDSSEVEPFPEGNVIVGRGALIDATIWKHDLLKKQK